MSDGFSLSRAIRNLKVGVVSGKMKVYDDAACRQLMWDRPAGRSAYPCVYVAWDNSPRRGKNGIVFINGSPDVFQAALKNAIDSTKDYPHDERLVFVNGWNEWAEGNHLEPDLKYGHDYLRAVRRALAESAPAATATKDRDFPTTPPPRLKAA